MEPPRENSPSTPSRYLNSYLQQNTTELFHQNFQQRQLQSQQQFYAAAATADNLTTTNNSKAYLKRHHQNYHHDKAEASERDKKYEKYDKKEDDKSFLQQHAAYDTFSNDGYATVTPVASSASNAAATAKNSTPAAVVPPAKNLSNGKKTKGRVKIKMEYIDNKLRRYTTFSKRKTGIMKKAYELSTLTGTQVMLLVASETGHVYTFATRKLQPMITSEAGKTLIQTCLNSPDIPTVPASDQRMSATGFEETELNYSISEMGEAADKAGDKDDITTTDESGGEESSNDENYLQNQKSENQRNFEDDKMMLHQQLMQQQKINEKMLDQKLLLENLSSLPQDILQNLIRTGQLQLSMDEDGISQCISIPIAIQTENSQEIITRKIPIKLLNQHHQQMAKIKHEHE